MKASVKKNSKPERKEKTIFSAEKEKSEEKELIAQVTKEKESLLGQNEDLLNKLKRALADYQNLQQRVSAQRQQFIDMAQEETIKDFLPVFDNLERAATSTKDPGIVMVVKQFGEVLTRKGLTTFGEIGDDFDPHRYECIEIAEGDEGKVVSVLEKGFSLGSKVIKAAKVKVGKAKS